MTGLIRTAFLLDGSNVAAELENGRVTNNYLRGANLIRWTSGMGTGYYLYNAHGDVVNLTNPAGASYRTYSYDAFGKQKNPDNFDFNPFRYCGEYYDKESGNYYLRSRYYNPANGRFTQPDSHWNSVNRIYGDNPQKINERQDALGTTLYSYRPQISAIMQSGNLYAYALNNPLRYSDSSGQIVTEAILLFMAAHPWLTAAVVSVGTVVIWNGLRYVCNKAGEWITEAISTPAQAPAFTSGASAVSGAQATTAIRDRNKVNWNIDANHKSHIWHGSGNKHENGWRRLGFDPQDPKSWEKLLPILQEIYENGMERQTITNPDGSIVHKIYYYVTDLSAEIRVVITELEKGILVLSDASVQ